VDPGGFVAGRFDGDRGDMLAVHFAQHLPAIYGAHSSWRYTLISGLIPAIPLIIIRPFLPESSLMVG